MGKEDLKLTGRQINRLKRLRDFILNEVTDEQFHMRSYRMTAEGSFANYYSKRRCGTVGCALGWLPVMLREQKDGDKSYWHNDIWGDTVLSFTRYGEVKLGLTSNNLLAWDYLFDAEWEYHDNTREGFAERVDILLEFPDIFLKKTEEDNETVESTVLGMLE